jgi:hypothetical protein
VLAFQLLQSGNAFKEDFVSGTEVYALEQGLKMMKTVRGIRLLECLPFLTKSQVLNDVLDFESALS